MEATPAGGRVTVEARAAGGGIVLTVSDTGPGIAPEVAADLFTPFATTKKAGTGLGLAVARRVTVEHGGTPTANNQSDGGECFTVTLPAAEPDRAEVAHRCGPTSRPPTASSVARPPLRRCASRSAGWRPRA